MNGFLYPRYYLLANGIYPRWSCFVQMIHEPQSEKRFHFAIMQESTCKDVESAFGVLQLYKTFLSIGTWPILMTS